MRRLSKKDKKYSLIIATFSAVLSLEFTFAGNIVENEPVVDLLTHLALICGYTLLLMNVWMLKGIWVSTRKKFLSRDELSLKNFLRTWLVPISIVWAISLLTNLTGKTDFIFENETLMLKSLAILLAFIVIWKTVETFADRRFRLEIVEGINEILDGEVKDKKGSLQQLLAKVEKTKYRDYFKPSILSENTTFSEYLDQDLKDDFVSFDLEDDLELVRSRLS